MSNVKVQGDVGGSGTVTIAAPNTNSDFTLSLPSTSAPILAGSCITLSASAPANTLVTDASGNVDGTRVDGFLAHEAHAIVPEAVTGEKDGEDMQGIDQSKLVPLLTAALQDALKRIEALEAQLNP